MDIAVNSQTAANREINKTTGLDISVTVRLIDTAHMRFEHGIHGRTCRRTPTTMSTYGNTFVSVASNLVTQKNWFKTKLAWLEKNIGSPIVTPVSDLHTEPAATGKTYNLQGIEVPATTPGLVIRNGKLIKQ